MDFSFAGVIFWACALALLYTYIGYPLFLAIFSQGASAEAPSSASLPKVSVIVAAYNEEECIARKIGNTLDQNYPAGLLECIVISDGSTDRTAEVARSISDSRLTVLAQRSRQGKCLALNRGVKDASGEILVFTDANATLEPGAVWFLARHFPDPRIGLVSGKGVITERREGNVHVVTNKYLEYEQFIREGENRFGYIAWADGALYAMRKVLFRELKPQHANDFLHPIQTVLAGYKAVFEPAAIFREPASNTSAGEFWRQVRMIGQGIYIFLTEAPKLLAKGHLVVLWQLSSHRMLRWMGSVFLLGALLSNGYLADHSALYQALLAGQIVFYTVALLGGLAEGFGWRLQLFTLPYYFCLVNFAGMVAFFRVLSGSVQATWTPVRLS